MHASMERSRRAAILILCTPLVFWRKSAREYIHPRGCVICVWRLVRYPISSDLMNISQSYSVDSLLGLATTGECHCFFYHFEKLVVGAMTSPMVNKHLIPSVERRTTVSYGMTNVTFLVRLHRPS